MYISRHAESTVKELARMFGAILVTGPRQVGKTAMMEHQTDGMRYASLDDPLLRAGAEEDSGAFFKDYPPPVFVDEIQKAPALFEQIKLILDRERKKGQFFLCGSQQFQMMKGVSESLAGRLGFVTLLGLSLRESHGIAFDAPFLPTEEYFDQRKQYLTDISYDEVWDTIHRGSMPELQEDPEISWEKFYSAYVNTYIERDVLELSETGDIVKFTRFMQTVAASTGQLLNLSSLARDIDISQPTAERWLSILVASNLVYLLQPYSNNLKRAIKTPKLYFLDTGLAAYLTGWSTPVVLKRGAMAGAFFESFVISEIVKSYYNRGKLHLPLYFYRDRDMNEIDLIIAEDGILYPIEIRKHTNPKRKDVDAFGLLEKIPGAERGPGGVVCLCDRLITLQGSDKVIPVGYL